MEKPMNMRLHLYYKDGCPLSDQVRNYIVEHHLRNQVEYRDIEHSGEARHELQVLTGKEQVPCLVLDTTPILESELIIGWLQANLVETAQPPA